MRLCSRKENVFALLWINGINEEKIVFNECNACNGTPTESKYVNKDVLKGLIGEKS